MLARTHTHASSIQDTWFASVKQLYYFGSGAWNGVVATCLWQRGNYHYHDHAFHFSFAASSIVLGHNTSEQYVFGLDWLGFVWDGGWGSAIRFLKATVCISWCCFHRVGLLRCQAALRWMKPFSLGFAPFQGGSVIFLGWDCSISRAGLLPLILRWLLQAKGANVYACYKCCVDSTWFQTFFLTYMQWLPTCQKPSATAIRGLVGRKIDVAGVYHAYTASHIWLTSASYGLN